MLLKYVHEKWKMFTKWNAHPQLLVELRVPGRGLPRGGYNCRWPQLGELQLKSYGWPIFDSRFMKIM